MKRILFIVDSYGHIMSANGVCVREIVNLFYHKGYEIHVMCSKEYRELSEEKIDGIYVHRLSSNFYNKVRMYETLNSQNRKGKIARVIRRLLGVRTLLLAPFYPMRSPLFCLRHAIKASQLQKYYDFDLIISSFHPLEALWAGAYVKKRFNVKFCTYFLDSLTDNIPQHHIFNNKFMDYKGYIYEQKFFEIADLILNIKCHEKNFLKPKYDIYRHKMRIVDIPLLRNNVNLNSSCGGGYINITYTGSIRAKMLAHILDIFNNVEGVRLHFYGPNTILVPSLEYVVNHGQVSHNIAIIAQREADVLISMGNEKSAFIPSKIFEYMSTGKKIIHFYFDEHDSALSYYCRYRNALIININDNKKMNYETIMRFLSNMTYHVTYNELRSNFFENEAEYTVNSIIEFFERKQP